MAQEQIFVTPFNGDDLTKLADGIKTKYPDAPDMSGSTGGPVDVGHGYNISWSHVGNQLQVTINGGSMFMGMATSRLKSTIGDIIGRKV